jgi:hypothetical protein
VKPPDGNTILHIVGPFLFEAVNVYDQARQEIPINKHLRPILISSFIL